MQLFDERKAPGAVILGVAVLIAAKVTHGWVSGLIIAVAFVAALGSFAAMDRRQRSRQ